MFFDDAELPEPLALGRAVTLNPYKPRPLTPFTEFTFAELEAAAGRTVLVVDVECYINYFLIAFRCTTSNKVITLEISPETSFNPRFLSWILHSFKTVGFNTFSYDLPLLWLAYQEQDTTLLKAASDKLILESVRPSFLQTIYSYKAFPTDHIDLIEVCPLVGSLKLYGARLHTKRIQELPFEPSRVLTRDEAMQIKDYCVNADLPSTILLWNELKDAITLREELSSQYNIDLRSKSDAQIAEAVIGSEIQKLTGKHPKRPKIEEGTSYSYKIPSFVTFKTPQMQNALEIVKTAVYTIENGRPKVPASVTKLQIKIGDGVYRMGNGGLHSSEKTRVVKSDEQFRLRDFDVASYYPMIVLNQKLFPEHLGENFLNVYQNLVTRRLEAKAAKRKKEADSIKITINGAFGKLGSPYSILYAPDLLIQVTVTGQLCLLMLVEAFETAGIAVLSANTDGLAIKQPIGAESAVASIVAAWEAMTGFTTEDSYFKGLYNRDVNNFLVVKTDDETKVKGVYSEVGSALNSPLSKNPEMLICNDAIKELIVKGTPIETTIRNCRDITRFVTVRNVTGGAHKNGDYLGKVVRFYYATGETGNLEYVKNGNKVPNSDGARPLMDLPELMPEDIDYGRYITETNKMLEEIGYYERPKQMKFW